MIGYSHAAYLLDFALWLGVYYCSLLGQWRWRAILLLSIESAVVLTFNICKHATPWQQCRGVLDVATTLSYRVSFAVDNDDFALVASFNFVQGYLYLSQMGGARQLRCLYTFLAYTVKQIFATFFRVAIPLYTEYCIAAVYSVFHNSYVFSIL